MGRAEDGNPGNLVKVDAGIVCRDSCDEDRASFEVFMPLWRPKPTPAEESMAESAGLKTPGTLIIVVEMAPTAWRGLHPWSIRCTPR